MPIVSSIIESTSQQRDGRAWIRELHTDQVGVQYERNYLANAGLDTAAALAAYAILLATDIRDREIARNIASITANGSLADTSTIYSTAAQNFAVLREAYRTALRVEAIMMADFLNSLSNTQLQAAFEFTAGQVTTLRTNKLQPAATLAASIRASAGQ